MVEHKARVVYFYKSKTHLVEKLKENKVIDEIIQIPSSLEGIENLCTCGIRFDNAKDLANHIFMYDELKELSNNRVGLENINKDLNEEIKKLREVIIELGEE